jgi:hypothetical protein
MLRLYFYIDDDNLSKKVMILIHQVMRTLITRFEEIHSYSSEDFVPYVLSSGMVKLSIFRLNLSKRSDLLIVKSCQISRAFFLENKDLLGISEVPSIKLNDKQFFKEEAFKITYEFLQLLSKRPDITTDVIRSFFKKWTNATYKRESEVPSREINTSLILKRVNEYVTNILTRLKTPPIISSYTSAGKTPIEKMDYKEEQKEWRDKIESSLVLERNIVRASINKCIDKLNKLYDDGRISKEAYEKRLKVYRYLLGETYT